MIAYPGNVKHCRCNNSVGLGIYEKLMSCRPGTSLEEFKGSSTMRKKDLYIQHSISVVSYLGFLADTVCGLALEA